MPDLYEKIKRKAAKATRFLHEEAEILLSLVKYHQETDNLSPRHWIYGIAEEMVCHGGVDRMEIEYVDETHCIIAILNRHCSPESYL